MESKNSSPAHKQADQLQENSGTSASLQPDLNKVTTLVVTGFPEYTQMRELKHVFAAYGSVWVEREAGNRAVLHFESADVAAGAMRASGTLLLYGAVLTVKPAAADAGPRSRGQRDKKSKKGRSRKDKKSSTPSDQEQLSPSKIDFSGSFHEQLASVMNTVRLSQEEVANISRLYADVESTLEEYWPGCTAIPFGSLTSGLGIKTSDADCFVHVPEESRRGETLFVNTAKKLLQRHPDKFMHVLSIPRANTPIVKFLHRPTRTYCDLSFKTSLGVRNSGLITFLLHADLRLLPVAVFLKYWGKVGGFTGSGKLTNYALTMLLIFYVQQLGILPAVSRLQDEAPAHSIGPWNAGFLFNLELIPSPPVPATIPELIGGFFVYYAKFNFQEDIVCPLLGRTLKKSAFEDLDGLPNELQLYVHNVREKNTNPLRVHSHMCVQDPFEQCHNVAAVVSERCAKEFKACLDFAANVYEQEKNNDCVGFLEKILSWKPKVPPKRTSQEYRANVSAKDLRSLPDQGYQSVVREIVFQIFEQIFKLNFEEKQPTVNKSGTKEKYVGVLYRAVWKRKKFARFYDSMNLDFLEKQIRITNEILNVDKNQLNIQFQLAIYFSSTKRNATISLKFLEGDGGIFKDFAKYFLSVAHHWVKQLLVPYLVSPTDSNNRDDKVDDYNDNISNEDDDEAVSSEEENSTDTDSQEAEHHSQVVENTQAMGNDRQVAENDTQQNQGRSTSKPIDTKVDELEADKLQII